MRNVFGKVLFLALALTPVAPVASARAASITYDVDQMIGSGRVVGTITTDGTIGTLGAGSIADWLLTLTSGNATYNLNTLNSVVSASGSDVTATTSSLLFNYSGSDYGYLLFQAGLFGGSHYYCNQATGSYVCQQGASVVPESYLDGSFQNVGRLGSQVIGTTAVSAVPLPPALPLFGAAVLTLAGLGYRFRRREANA